MRKVVIFIDFRQKAVGDCFFDGLDAYPQQSYICEGNCLKVVSGLSLLYHNLGLTPYHFSFDARLTLVSLVKLSTKCGKVF
ncbi:MAG: hypothetical protein JXR56_02000 [Candidatus Cloacimonetes bacterium]|nr:hypothetical protein [Candidatus Cloacimonadota bacterium]